MAHLIGNNIHSDSYGIVDGNLIVPTSNELISDGSGLFGQPFTTEWPVAGDATARTITLPLVQNRAEGALAYNCVVDWGDGTAQSLVTSYNDANRIHTYASDGTYIVKIYGVMEGWSFNNGGDKLKITKVINFGSAPSFEGFKYLKGGFFGCSNLTSLGIGSIPARGDGIESDGFFTAFHSTAISSVPSSLFSKHPLAETMEAALMNTDIVTLPNGLLSKLTAVTSFQNFLRSCSNLTSIPDGFFDNNILATVFHYTFRDCSSLETTPSNLFRNNTAVTSFLGAFLNCVKHQQNADLFYADGEQSTRFLNQSVNFSTCFQRGSFSGTQGAAPDLWNCSFGTGSPTTTSCWGGAGNSTSSLTNYTSIPGGWI